MDLTPYQQTVFWTRQFAEHLQFLAALFTDPGLKKEATRLGAQYERERTRALASDAQVVALIMPINNEVRAFQQGALDRLLAGEFLGWCFPMFAAHITREMDLYAHLVGEGPAPGDSVDDVVKQLGAEHALFAAHLLDPSEDDQIKGANEAAALLYSTMGNVTRNDEAAKVEQDIARFLLDERISRGGALSIIPVALTDHVIREQYYFTNALIGTMPSASLAQNGFVNIVG